MSPPDFSPKKLRIAVFNRTFSPTGGGAERYSIALVEQLSARHEVHVFAQEIDHQWPGVTYHKVSAPLRKPRWVNQLWFATATWWATRSGLTWCIRMKTPGTARCRRCTCCRSNTACSRGGMACARVALDQGRDQPAPAGLPGAGARPLLARPGRQVVVTSESLRPIMAAAYPDCRAAMSVVTPGITLPSLPVAAAANARRGRGWACRPRARCLLFVGNDYRKKGLEALLQAMTQLPADVVLAVVGNPAHIAEFRALAGTLKLGARVFFLGALKDVSPAYEAADILVHPTFEDTFAMVVLEAMAHGLPVVVSGPKYCGIAGLLSQGANALLLDDPRDAGELARVLGDLLGPGGAAGNAVRGRCGLCRALPVAGNRAAAGSAVFFSRRGEGREFLKTPGRLRPPA
jgi:glycosyltransferase involved in cell wall biosynthesis